MSTYRTIDARKLKEGLVVAVAWRDRVPNVQLAVLLVAVLAATWLALSPEANPLPRVLGTLFSLGLGYFGIAMLVGETRLSVESATLVVRHGPLPSFGFGPHELHLPAADLVGISTSAIRGVVAHRVDGTDVSIVDPAPSDRVRVASALADALDLPIAIDER